MKLDRDAIKALVPTRKQWYEIRNVSSTKAEIRIYDEISLWGVTAEDFVNELDGLDVEELTVRVNSPGGNVFDGIAIHNALVAHQADVTVIVDALAASAASFIVQAGDRRVMMKHSQMMIHNAHGVAIGDADAMTEMATILRQQNEVIADIYADRAGNGNDRQFYLDLMAEEKLLRDDEAVDKGLADEVMSLRQEDSEESEEEESKEDSNSDTENRVNWDDLFTLDLEELI